MNFWHFQNFKGESLSFNKPLKSHRDFSDHLNNMVANTHRYGHLRSLFWLLKSVKIQKHCKTFVLLFVHCITIIWIAFGRVWMCACPLFWGDWTQLLKCMQQMWDIMQHMREPKHSDHKVMYSAPIAKGLLGKLK